MNENDSLDRGGKVGGKTRVGVEVSRKTGCCGFRVARFLGPFPIASFLIILIHSWKTRKPTSPFFAPCVPSKSINAWRKNAVQSMVQSRGKAVGSRWPPRSAFESKKRSSFLFLATIAQSSRFIKKIMVMSHEIDATRRSLLPIKTIRAAIYCKSDYYISRRFRDTF
jgi:hypothetical protein